MNKNVYLYKAFITEKGRNEWEKERDLSKWWGNRDTNRQWHWHWFREVNENPGYKMENILLWCSTSRGWCITVHPVWEACDIVTSAPVSFFLDSHQSLFHLSVIMILGMMQGRDRHISSVSSEFFFHTLRKPYPFHRLKIYWLQFLLP
jgi:hypothetical protein